MTKENPREEIGDNSRSVAEKAGRDQLKAFVERIERMAEEKKAISDDIRDIYAEAKGNGFDTKALRKLVRMREQDPNTLKEEQLILETYCNALGMGVFG